LTFKTGGLINVSTILIRSTFFTGLLFGNRNRTTRI